MLRHCIAIGSFLLLFSGGLLFALEPLKAGLQPGEHLPGIFEPLNVNGEFAGQKHCLVCENGLNPVVMIFARDVNDPLVRLVGKLDAAATTHRKQELGSFVVFLNEREGMDKQLAETAKKSALKHVVLSIDDPAGPEDFKVTKDADVIVVLYVKHEVKANHAFRKGELNDKAIEKILADLPKIVPAK
jgi:hypothetical protein